MPAPKGSIRLSPKHGVNPTIPLCWFCNAPKNEVLLVGLLPSDQEAPRNTVWDRRPCDKCAGLMEQGVILISTRDEAGDNPYRSGGWVVVKAEFIERVVSDPAVRAKILDARWVFVPDPAWDRLGLPRPEAPDPAAPGPGNPAQDEAQPA